MSKTARIIFILCVSVSLMGILILPGCSFKDLAGKQQKDSAALLLAESLKATTSVPSYHFRGNGKIKYMNIAAEGSYQFNGSYRSPGRSSMKLQLNLGNARYHAETFRRNGVMYRIADKSRVKVLCDPNTFVQPDYKYPAALFERIINTEPTATIDKDIVIEGKKYRVLRLMTENPQLKAYLRKEFNKTISIEPERRVALNNFLKNSTFSQAFTLYIDPDSVRINKIIFRQNISTEVSGKKLTTDLYAEYFLSGFGAPAKMPF